MQAQAPWLHTHGVQEMECALRQPFTLGFLGHCCAAGSTALTILGVGAEKASWRRRTVAPRTLLL